MFDTWQDLVHQINQMVKFVWKLGNFPLTKLENIDPFFLCSFEDMSNQTYMCGKKRQT
jgi:hypothetical protein